MSLLPRREDGKIDYKNMWEVKLLRGIFMFFIYLLLFVYTTVGAQSAWTWIQLRYHGGDFKIENIDKAAEALSYDEEQLLLTELLTKYPPQDIGQITEKLQDQSAEFHATYFFTVANRYYKAGNIDEAIFWTMLARFRLRYDAVRCQHDASGDISKFFALMYTGAGLQQEIAALTPPETKAYLQRVLDWDAAHPPENSPRYFCKYVGDLERVKNVNISPRADWPAIRLLLRTAAQAHIEGDNE